MSENELQEYTDDQRLKYLGKVEGYVPGEDYILCKIEGCPRTEPVGQVEACGAWFKLGLNLGPDDLYCGSATTLRLWEEKGLINFD